MDRHRTIIVAEIGENHLGDMDMARNMIDAAAGAGADIVKFQSYRGVDVLPEDPEREWFGRVELSDQMHLDMKTHAEARGVEFLSSPFTVERATFLCEGLGMRKIKIASSEMLNFALLDYVNEHADTVLMSTGLATIPEIRQAVGHLGKVKQTYVLHCCTQYPAHDHQANLLAMNAIRRELPGYSVGYSDHTLGIDAAVAAVSLGASVIEKHFTLSKLLPGTDHVVSATPEELTEMIQRIRRVEVLLGNPAKEPVAEELEIRDAVRNRWIQR